MKQRLTAKTATDNIQLDTIVRVRPMSINT